MVTPDISAVDAIRVAVDLALQTNQVQVASVVLDHTARLAMQILAEDQPAPGVLLGLIEVFPGARESSLHDIDALLTQYERCILVHCRLG